jgi:hypothetical protein
MSQPGHKQLIKRRRTSKGPKRTNRNVQSRHHTCVVATGTLSGKYTCTIISFVRGQDTTSDVEIYHIVALSDAWQKGVQQLSAEQRKELAKRSAEPHGRRRPTNSTNGDKDAATWLPPNEAFRCDYVDRRTALKAKYNLWFRQTEHDSITGILTGCK